MEGSETALQSEAELVARARHGAAPAWETIIHSHQEPVFRLAYLLLGDADEAQDVAQETFVRAYRALDRFDSERPLRPWLLRIAANLAHNQRRSAGRYLATLRRVVSSEPPLAMSIEERSAQRVEAARLWQAVRRLRPAEQQVIYLRYFLELSVEETAESLGVAGGTVKSRLHRALTSLRRVIEHEFPDLQRMGAGEG